MSYLSASLILGGTGCGQSPERSQLDYLREDSEAGERNYAALLQRLEEESAQVEVPAEHRDGEKFVDLADEAREKAAEPPQFASFEEFERLFEQRTGRAWNEFKGEVDAAADRLRELDPSVPDATALLARLETIREDFGGKSQELIDRATAEIEGFHRSADQLDQLVDHLRGQVEDVVGRTEALVDAIDSLDGKSAGEAQAKLQTILATEVAGLLDAIEGLQDRSFVESVQAIADLRKTALKQFAAAKELLAGLKEFVDKETRSLIEDFEQKSEDFLTDVAEVANTVASVASMSLLLIKAFAINPWLGAAVLAVLLIMALFNGFSGGDGDGGDGEGGGGNNRPGPRGDEEGGQQGAAPGPGGKDDGKNQEEEGDDDQQGGGGGRDEKGDDGTGPPESQLGFERTGGSAGVTSSLDADGPPWFTTEWIGEELHLHVWLTDSKVHHPLVLHTGDPESAADMTRILAKIKDSQGSGIKVSRIAPRNDSQLPIAVDIDGLNPPGKGVVTITWSAAKTFVVNGLAAQ